MLSKREMLVIRPASGSGALPVQFRLETDSDAWRALLIRCKSGEIDAARDEGAPEVPEYIVPAKCPTCGGAQSKAGRIRGLAAIRCDYCGANIMLEKAS
jgi:DNA-directed RNA polymerase subunit RPC12/RpoP